MGKSALCGEIHENLVHVAVSLSYALKNPVKDVCPPKSYRQFVYPMVLAINLQL